MKQSQGAGALGRNSHRILQICYSGERNFEARNVSQGMALAYVMVGRTRAYAASHFRACT